MKSAGVYIAPVNAAAPPARPPAVAEPGLGPVPRAHATAFALALLTWMFCALFRARSPMAGAVVALAVLSVVRLGGPGFPVGVWRQFPRVAGAFVRTPDYSLPALLVVAYALPGLYALDRDFWLAHLWLSAPALAIPFAFFALRAPLRRWWGYFWAAWASFAALAAVAVLLHTFGSMESLVVLLGKGQAFPTPLAHTRFGMILAITAVASWYFAATPRELRGLTYARATRRVFVGCALALTFALHVFAIRTGLAMLYLGGAVLTVRLVGRRFGSVTAAAAVVALAGLAYASVAAFPTLERKVAYVRYDLARLAAADRDAYSDVGRLASIQAGWRVVRERPLFGASRAGLRETMRAEYARAGRDLGLLPHNQWLFSYGAAGVLGFLGAWAVLAAPLLRRRWWRQPLVAEVVVMLVALWCFDAAMESDVGAAVCMVGVYLAKAR